MPVNSLSLFSSSAIHCLPLSFALLSSSTSAEYPLFIIFPSFNEIEGSAIIAEFNNSFKPNYVSDLHISKSTDLYKFIVDLDRASKSNLKLGDPLTTGEDDLDIDIDLDM